MFHTQQERRLYITLSCRDSTDWAYILYVFQGCMEERCNTAAIQLFRHSQSRLVALFPISCIFCAGKRFRIWIAVDRSCWKRINGQTVRVKGGRERRGWGEGRRKGGMERRGGAGIKQGSAYPPSANASMQESICLRSPALVCCAGLCYMCEGESAFY